MMTKQELLAGIGEKVDHARRKHHIHPQKDFSSSKSEEHFGEENVRVDDLLFARRGTGFWNQIGSMGCGDLTRIDKALTSWI